MLPASCGNTILCFYQFQMVQIQTKGFPGLEDLPVRYVIFLFIRFKNFATNKSLLIPSFRFDKARNLFTQ
ncbi:hypothetical protein BMS3Abin08_00679 [bacterium BMS3Abin08]|nr:hypothetical protein BMS3Abin08_00679 [bacterium BMS3Abin08]